jgi:hypothetical protein
MSRRIALIALVVAATTAIACSDSNIAAPTRASYSLQLHQDSAGVYEVMPECPPNGMMYCWAWRPSTAVTAASLDASALRLVQAGNTMVVDSTFNLDSLPFSASDLHCSRLTMRLTESPAGVHGTWSQQLDCHGRMAMGTVTGTRN